MHAPFYHRFHSGGGHCYWKQEDEEKEELSTLILKNHGPPCHSKERETPLRHSNQYLLLFPK